MQEFSLGIEFMIGISFTNFVRESFNVSLKAVINIAFEMYSDRGSNIPK